MPKMTDEVEREAGALNHQEKADRQDGPVHLLLHTCTSSLYTEISGL
jgi:hypothetical protein